MDGNNNSISNNGFKLIMQYRNVIMGIATIWIFIFHAWIPIFNNPTGNITLFCHYIEEYIRKMGYCGVDIFLLLSGMGLTYAIKKGSLARFYCRRIRRVFIPYFVTALVCWPVKHWTIVEFLKNVTGVTFYTQHIHTFCWFVPAIITLYLVFPLYYKFFSKAKSKFLFTALSIFIWFFISLLLHGHMRFVERKHHHPFIDPMERVELWCRCDHCGQPVKINIEWLTNACESINSMIKFTQRYRLAELWSHKLVTWCTHCRETIRLREFFISLHFHRYIPTTVQVATELGRKKYLNENVYDWDKMNKLESDFQNMSTVEFASTYDMDMDGDVLNVTLFKRGDALNVIPIKRYTEYPWLQKEVKHGKRKHHN